MTHQSAQVNEDEIALFHAESVHASEAEGTTAFDVHGWNKLRERKVLYQKTTLENGLRVVTETMPGMNSVAIGILIDASPRDETQDTLGLAHLVEHAMFLGTSSRDRMQISRLMDVGGGNMGAFTTRDYTCYFATVLDDYYTYALDLLGDILLNSVFPADSLESEKEAILREIATSEDFPHERANSRLKAFAWPKHPLGQPIAGTVDTVCPLTREDVIYFVHKNYAPDRVIVAAAGNVDPFDFVAQVRDSFWRMMGQSDEVSCIPPSYQPGVTFEELPVSQVYFSLGMRSCPYADQDRYALHVLCNILGGGISSRLFRRLREESGMVYDIHSEYVAYRDDGMLVVEGSTAPEYLLHVLGLVLFELWGLINMERPVEADELWKAKMHIRGQHLIAGESTNTCMSRLATQEFYFGKRISSDEILRQIDAVDARFLERLCDHRLRDELQHVTLSIVGPQAHQHYDKSSIEELLAGYRQSTQQNEKKR